MRWGRGRKILLGTLLWGILVFLVLAMEIPMRPTSR